MRTHTNRIPIATAADVAARLPYPHTTAGGWYRTSTALCHGGDNRSALSFRDGERPGESPLRVYCHSHNCDATAIRHALQQATGLWLCRCDACFAAFRAGQPPPGANAVPLHGARSPQNGPGRANRHFTPKNAQNNAQSRSGPLQGKDTNAYAAELWAAAQPSISEPAANCPAAQWLAQRDLWPDAEPLPEAVRWLARNQPKFPEGQPGSTADGALVMAMRPLDNPAASPRKVQLVAVDSAGRKARHWPDKTDKRTYGTGPAYGLLWRGQRQLAAYKLHICEGLADGLRILRYADEPALVAVCAGTGYGRIEPGHFEAVTLWPDADEAGAQPAYAAAQRWADLGYNVTVKWLPPGHDPASAPLDRSNGRTQIEAESEHLQPDPVAAAYDALSAAIADGKNDPDARATLQEALTTNSDHTAPARTGADIAAGLRSKEGGYQEQARSEIRKLLDPGPSLTDILTVHDPHPSPVSWLVNSWMPDATLSVLTGAGGAGKSRIALQLAVAVATGNPEFIYPSEKKRPLSLHAPAVLNENFSHPVVFAAWETRKLAWQNRLAAVCGQGTDRAERIRQLSDHLHYINMRPEGGLWGAEHGVHTSTAGNWLRGGTALLSYAAEAGARLLIIDPLAAAFVQNENDRSLVRAFLSALDQWAEDHNCAVLIISHPPKGDSAQSGSTDWRNGVQAVWTLETAQIKEKDGKKLVPAPGGERVLQVDKLNEGAVPDPVYLNFENGRFAEVEKPTNQNTNVQSPAQEAAQRDENEMRKLGG